MDTSETYVEMCKAATEIQEQESDFHRADNVVVGYSPENKTYTMFCLLLDLARLALCREYDNWVWLPRQDQLQEMVIKGYWPVAIMYKVAHWADVIPDASKWSMEQIWLRFMMQEKFGKVWVEDTKRWQDYKQDPGIDKGFETV